MVIKVERIYNNPRGNKTFRVLVDRLWPRGLRKDNVKVDLWKKDIAPSNSLRKWFSHDENKWNDFKARYFKELEKNSKSVNTILDKINEGPVTLLYGSKEEKYNNAIAFKEYLEEKIR